MKKGFVMDKRGLSPAIATVLLVMLVLVLAALIFFWAMGFFSEQIEKSGQAIENVCPSVNFDANINDGKLEIVNRGIVNINRFELKKITGGNSKNIELPEDLTADVGDSFSKTIDLSDNPEKVIVYPVLLGKVRGGAKTQPYTCLDMGKTITL